MLFLFYVIPVHLDFVYFNMAARQKNFLLKFGWSQSPSANLVLFWFGLVQSHRKKNVSRNGYPPDCLRMLCCNESFPVSLHDT